MRKRCSALVQAVLLLGLLVGPLPLAGGEAPGSGTVPRELVEALFTDAGGAGAPRLLVGRLPRELASEIHVPSGARVLGSLAWESSATVALASPGTPTSVRQGYERALAEAGWRLLEGTGAGSGFVAARPRLFCGPKGRYLLLFVGRRDAASSFVRLQVDSGAGRPPCPVAEAPGRSTSYSPSPSESSGAGAPRVVLENPPGASGESPVPPSTAGGAGGGELAVELATDLSPADLLSFYGKQLTEAGWRPLETAADGGLASRSWLLEEAPGRRWLGVLVATELPVAQRRTQVVFRMRELSGPEGR